MAWVWLIIAGLLEIVWAVGLKYTQGFTKWLPTTITIIAMLASVYVLSKAIKLMSISIAYPVWTGIGAVGTVIFGIILFGESASIIKLICVALIVIGIIGLKLSF